MENSDNNQKIIHLFTLTLALCLISQPAWANMGVPMLFITLPMMIVGLLPIIAVEGYIIKKRLSLKPKQAFRSAAISNVFSTFIGLPITWFVLVFLQIITGGGTSHGINTPLEKFLAVTWQAPWLVPYEREIYWMVPAAMLVLFIPFFFASWKSEAFVISKLHKDIDPQTINAACLKANAITYIMLTPVAALFYFG